MIAGAALSVGGLALAPIDGAAQAQSRVICVKLVGVGHHYTVVAYPCANGGPGYTLVRRKRLSVVHAAQAI